MFGTITLVDLQLRLDQNGKFYRNQNLDRNIKRERNSTFPQKFFGVSILKHPEKELKFVLKGLNFDI